MMRQSKVKKTANAVRQKPYTILFDQKFMNVPLFLADMQTTEASDTANVRWQNKDLYGVDVHIDEEQSRDVDTNHSKEALGYVVVDFTEQ